MQPLTTVVAVHAEIEENTPVLHHLINLINVTRIRSGQEGYTIKSGAHLLSRRLVSQTTHVATSDVAWLR